MDCYCDLLTDKQQDYLTLYYEEDLSLAEIAEDLNVSRNAVYDNLKRAVASLEDYESKLHLDVYKRQGWGRCKISNK